MSRVRSHKRLRDRLIIFSRYPIPGQVKTRLIPTLGKAGSADLQKKLTEMTVRKARAFSSCYKIDVELRFEGGSVQQMYRWFKQDVFYLQQPQGNLGDRMYVSFKEAFQNGCGRVVLIGSDIPEINTAHLEQAFESLNRCDLVLGPSRDGGYWLVGMKVPMDIFAGVAWGTDRVLAQSLKRAEAFGLHVDLLNPLADIDTIDDLKAWKSTAVEQKPYVSIVIPALNESRNIVSSIESAEHEDAEIIVVDGGSYDNTIKRALDAGARVEQCAPGRAVQQNHGAESARGKILLFLHADTVLPEGYLDNIFEAFMDSKILVGAFRFKTDWDCGLMRMVEALTNLRSQFLRLPYGDQGIFLKKSTFNDMGGFPPVPIAEDFLFIRRLVKAGGITIAPTEAVTSSRRWRKLGIWRTILINQMIVAGCFMGVSPTVLSSIYRQTLSRFSSHSSTFPIMR